MSRGEKNKATADLQAQQMLAAIQTGALNQDQVESILQGKAIDDPADDQIDTIEAATMALAEKEDAEKQEVANGFIKKHKKKEISRKLSVTERAKIKFNEQDLPKAEGLSNGLSQVEMDEMLDNPMTQLYNLQHPEVMQSAKERSYSDYKDGDSV